MRTLVQRVTEAAVTVVDDAGRETTVGRIGPGLVALVGVTHGDGVDQADRLADRIANLRVFEDEAGRMNRSLLELGAAALVVSQFTLYGDTRKGRRPSYVAAARPEHAEPLVERVVQRLEELGVEVATGRFRTRMRVRLVNDGPVTLTVDA